MTGEQLEELEQLISAADASEWNVFPPFGSGWAIASKTPHPYAPHADMPIVEAGVRDIDHANVKAIAALHNVFPSLVKALREARAERDTFKAECASISEEFGLPPTIRPAEGEIRRMLDGWRESRAEVERLRQGNASLSEELHRLYQQQRQGDADWKHLRAEVEMLRGVGCGELREGAEVADGPCGACLKCARRERDEARAEVEELSPLVTTSDRQLGDEIIGLRRELSEALRRMKKAQNERDFANERLRRLKAETGWAKRECGCQCQWEAGDSACPVHGEEAK